MELALHQQLELMEGCIVVVVVVVVVVLGVDWLVAHGAGSGAKARTFHFPLDTQTGEEIARIPEQRGVTVQRTNANNNVLVLLWFRQKEMLKELTKNRRAHHRDPANKNKKIQTF